MLQEPDYVAAPQRKAAYVLLPVVASATKIQHKWNRNVHQFKRIIMKKCNDFYYPSNKHV